MDASSIGAPGAGSSTKPTGGASSAAANPASSDGESNQIGWRDFLKVVFDKLDKLVWALIALIAIFFYGPTWLPAALRRITKFKGGGFEFEFNAERARAVQASFKDSYVGFVEAAKGEYDRQAAARDLSVRLVNALRQLQLRGG
jgi:hypothetical protein